MKLGLCCISLRLQEEGHRFQTMTFSRFSALPYDQALQTLSSRILNNFQVTEKIVRYCKASGFSNYRLSSDLTPIINHPSVNLKLQDLPNAAAIFESLSSIAKAIKETGLKISAHPSEYISLTSPKEDVIANSTRDLESHAELFDLIGLPQSYEAPLNIHCRQDGDPETISSSFLKNFDKLSPRVKNRLVLEVNDNKEGIWSVVNLHKYYYQKANIPVTFDNLHHSFCNHGVSEREAFDMAYKTWNTVPVFHYSEGVDGSRKHADYATHCPPQYNDDVFWDVELKAKDLAISKMLYESR
jgi:UV DNA damage endonuclease